MNLSMDFNQAWAGYCARATRLGQPPVAGAMRTIASLIDVAEDFDLFVLDGFGVLNVGDQAVAGMPDIIAQLQKMGKKCVVLTNGATGQSHAQVGKFQKLGYQFDPAQIISSRDALIEFCHAYAQEPEYPQNIAVTPSPIACDDLPGNWQQMGTEVDLHSDVFALLSSWNWSAAHDEALMRSLQLRPRPVWCANPDLCAPFETYYSVEPGSVADRAALIDGVDVIYFGKPFANAYLTLERRLCALYDWVDLPRARTLMVGDTLHTDILGGAMAGLRTALMCDHGFFRDEQYASAIETTRLRPDYLITQR